MMNENFYKEIIKQSPFGYFYGQLVKDNQGKVIDIIILDTNTEFENLVNLNEENIIGRNILDIIPSIKNEKIELFNSNSTDQFIKSLNSWFKVNVISNDDKYIVVQLIETYREDPFMKSLIDSLPFCAWAKDKEGRHITINKKYEEDTGLILEEVRGKDDFEIWPDKIAIQFKEEDNIAMINKNIKKIHKFGINNEWYEMYKTAVKDEKGNSIGTVGFSLNINEEKRIKSEIEKNNKLLKTLIDCIPDYIFYKDLDGEYMALNQSLAREYFGKDTDELIGKKDREIITDKELLHSFKVQDEELIKEGKIKLYEESLTLLNGDTRKYETIKAPFFGENNEVVGIIGISRDITHRKIANQKLRESEEKFRQLAENIDGIFLMVEENKVIYVSPGYEKVVGRSCDDLYEDPMYILRYIHEEDRELFLNALEDEVMDVTFRIMRPDGEIRWIWCKSFHIKGENGQVDRIVIVGEDITAIKEAELEIDRLRTEFFANLSHEFRTPLNLMFSSLQMIELKLSKCNCNNKFGFEKYTNIIKQNSYRLLRLVNNLIDSTKIDAGYVETCRENHDIVDFIKNICNSVSGFASEKDIELTFNSEIDEKIISFDLDKMERVILNLISNAIKFNVPNGKIEVAIVSKENFVEIHVKDTGIGIVEDKIPYVFERFKQVNNRLTKVSEGSGIGLSLVKSLVEMQGGTIEAKSNFGEGTEFIVKLPDTLLKECTEVVCRNQIKSNSRVERAHIEFSDIYGLTI